MNWLMFILAVLATYRIAHMIAREDGPFDVFAILRGKVSQDSWVGRGLACVLCISFWVALLVGFVPDWLLFWLGVAGGVTVLFQVVYR